MLIEIKAGQFRKVSRLVRQECCNCMDGNIKLKSLFKVGAALMIGLGLNNNTFKKGSRK